MFITGVWQGLGALLNPPPPPPPQCTTKSLMEIFVYKSPYRQAGEIVF